MAVLICVNVLIPIKASNPTKLSVVKHLCQRSDFWEKLVKITRYYILNGVTVVWPVVVFTNSDEAFATDSSLCLSDISQVVQMPKCLFLIFFFPDAKRLIGRRFDDGVVQSDMKHWPFNVINDNTRPKVQVEYKGETKSFYPEEISSMVLTKMKEIAEAYLGKVTLKKKKKKSLQNTSYHMKCANNCISF